MHLSLQYGWTALMKASEAGHIECVQVLLDKGADVNKQTWVSGVIIHTMQHVPRVPVVSEDMCTRTLLCAYMYMPCCLMTESSTSLDEATCMMVTSFTKRYLKREMQIPSSLLTSPI